MPITDSSTALKITNAAGTTTLANFDTSSDSINLGGVLNIVGSGAFMTVSGNLQMGGAGNQVYWSNSTLINAPSNGLLLIENNQGTGFTRLDLGGTTSSFPALAVNGSDLQVIRADGSTNANLLVTGNVGIGTTNPTSALAVAGNLDLTTNGYIRAAGQNVIQFAGTSPTFNYSLTTPSILSYSNQDLVYNIQNSTYSHIFKVNNVEALRIAQGGLVGIGTTAPLAGLDVEKGNGGNPAMIVNQPLGGDIFDASASGQTKFVIANNGNVGIGTTSPGATLDVNGLSYFRNQVYLNNIASYVGNNISFVNNGVVSVNGLLTATTGGFATYTKAGIIADTDFTNTAVDGMIGVDSTDSRLYVRSGGAWHYIAFTGGFQIPSNEAYVYDQSTKSFDTTQPLADGDFLIPFVEKHLNDGALHGMYTSFNSVKGLLFASEDQQIASQSSQLDNLKFEISNLKSNLNDQISNVLNIENCDISNSFEIKNCKLKILTDSEAQGAVTFDSTATFNGNSVFNAIADFFNNVVFHGNVAFDQAPMMSKSTAGTAIISTYSDHVDVVFDSPYPKTPIVTFNLVNSSTDQTFIAEGQQAYLEDVTNKGFTIKLPNLAVKDFTYNWMAFATNGDSVTKSTSVIQDILGAQATATPSAQPSPTPLRPTGFEGQAPVASATPTVAP